jgi:hypothetical protein
MRFNGAVREVDVQQPHPSATPSLLSAACPALMHLTWPLVLFALQISMQAHICHIQVSRGSVMQRGDADLVLTVAARLTPGGFPCFQRRRRLCLKSICSPRLHWVWVRGALFWSRLWDFRGPALLLQSQKVFLCVAADLHGQDLGNSQTAPLQGAVPAAL